VIRKNFLILFVIFIGFTVGCGGNSSVTNSNSSATVNSGQNNEPINTMPAFPANSNTTVPISNSAPSNYPALPGNVAVKKIPMQRDGATQNGPTQAAPDNSEISSALTENFVQTRTFKNHPQLEKVEATTLTKENNRKVIKVYLKGGKVIEISKDKILDPMVESADNILKATQ